MVGEDFPGFCDDWLDFGNSGNNLGRANFNVFGRSGDSTAGARANRFSAGTFQEDNERREVRNDLKILRFSDHLVVRKRRPVIVDAILQKNIGRRHDSRSRKGGLLWRVRQLARRWLFHR